MVTTYKKGLKQAHTKNELLKAITVFVIQISKSSGVFWTSLQCLSEISTSVLLISREDPYTKIMKEKEEDLEHMEALQQTLVAEECKGRRWRGWMKKMEDMSKGRRRRRGKQWKENKRSKRERRGARLGMLMRERMEMTREVFDSVTPGAGCDEPLLRILAKRMGRQTLSLRHPCPDRAIFSLIRAWCFWER